MGQLEDWQALEDGIQIEEKPKKKKKDKKVKKEKREKADKVTQVDENQPEVSAKQNKRK